MMDIKFIRVDMYGRAHKKAHCGILVYNRRNKTEDFRKVSNVGFRTEERFKTIYIKFLRSP